MATHISGGGGGGKREKKVLTEDNWLTFSSVEGLHEKRNIVKAEMTRTEEWEKENQ